MTWTARLAGGLAVAAIAVLLAVPAAGASGALGTPLRAAGSAAPAVRSAGAPWAIPVGAHPAAAPALYSTHYWAGAYFTGTAATPTKLSTTLRVPDAQPYAKEFYYVLLSVWDSAGSYDQIGFTNDYGTWGFAYSYTSSCAGTYYYSADQATLSRGVTYTFNMTLTGGGNLTFTVMDGAKKVASLTKHSGGKTFLEQSYYTCSSSTYYDYTDYEEIYYSVQQMPSFDFFFRANAANGAGVTAWSSMGAPPGGGTIAFAATEVEIENEAFWLTFNGKPDLVKVPKGTAYYNSSITVHKAFSGSNVTLSVSGNGTSFNVSFAPAAGAPGFNTTVSVQFGAIYTGVDYYLTLQATDGSGDLSYLTLEIYEK